jgi:hypothetical protein
MPTATIKKQSKIRSIEFHNKDDKHILSNYFVEPDGSSVQFEFQREKCTRNKDRAKFDAIGKRNPFEAKALGHEVKIRGDWEDVKVTTMQRLVREKFFNHSELAEYLLSTGDAELVKRSDCSESFWGKNSENVGENQLGQILMAVRAELKSEPQS